jgi:hypothetical protein
MYMVARILRDMPIEALTTMIPNRCQVGIAPPSSRVVQRAAPLGTVNLATAAEFTGETFAHIKINVES